MATFVEQARELAKALHKQMRRNEDEFGEAFAPISERDAIIATNRIVRTSNSTRQALGEKILELQGQLTASFTEYQQRLYEELDKLQYTMITPLQDKIGEDSVAREERIAAFYNTYHEERIAAETRLVKTFNPEQRDLWDEITRLVQETPRDIAVSDDFLEEFSGKDASELDVVTRQSLSTKIPKGDEDYSIAAMVLEEALSRMYLDASAKIILLPATNELQLIIDRDITDIDFTTLDDNFDIISSELASKEPWKKLKSLRPAYEFTYEEGEGNNLLLGILEHIAALQDEQIDRTVTMDHSAASNKKITARVRGDDIRNILINGFGIPDIEPPPRGAAR